jgi:phenylacetate-CoA ligase
MSELALRYLESLRRSQWLSPDDLARCQSPLMERLCRHAARETEFYRDRLGVLFAGGDPEAGAFQPDRWREVPVFGRADAQRAGPALFARAVPPEVGGARIGQTSGSTGRPLQFRLSVFLDIASAAALARCLESHELDLSGSLGYIKSDVESDCPAPLGNEGQNWNCVDPQARWCTLAASATIDQCVAWLRLRRPDYLMSYPSIVSAIMKELARGGEPIRLKAVISLGENVADGFAAAVPDRFGARHIDVYGAQEVGTFAHQCVTGPHLHVAAEMALVEILDDGGAPARPGQTGRIVATSFYSYAMPMIRYDIGDFAVPGEACACGRGLPTIARIVGRTRNVFRFADGTARWPRGLNVLTRYIDFVQIRVIQRDLARVEVHYVPGDDPGRNDEAGAARFLRDILHPDIAVEFVPLAEIPRGPSGKFEDFVSMVGDG